MKNERIKTAMFEHGIKQWELARIIGIHEASLSRKLRNELPVCEQDKIVDMIRQRFGERNSSATSKACECCGEELITKATKITINYPTRPLGVNSPRHQITYTLCDRCREKIDDYFRKLHRKA